VHALSLTKCLIAGASVATGILASGTSLAAEARLDRPSAARACATSQLVVWLEQSGAAAGTSYYDLHFTNLGTTCTLLGFPGVSAVSLAGNQIGVPARRNGTSATATLLTLAPGATVTSLVGIADAGNFPATTCHPTTAAGIRVYPPNQTTSKIVPYPFPACTGTKDGILTAQVVQRAFNPT
jgi:hypothetical protein